MDDLQLLYFDPEGIQSNATNHVPWSSKYRQLNKNSLSQEKGCESGNCKEEIQTSFTCQEGDVSFQIEEETGQQQLSHCSSSELRGSDPELSIMSEDELTSDASRTGRSADYAFISAVTCLLSGISLIAISYTVPRDVKGNPDTASAREMERLEWDNARVGAHLDRCVIAGLCLLTLGGVVLSTLLMVSMWKWEVFRRKAFAYSRQSATIYGSINDRRDQNPPGVHTHVPGEGGDLDQFLT